MRFFAIAAAFVAATSVCASVAVAQTATGASPSPSATPIPEIGRTKTRPLCVALRSAVGPAILAVQASDRAFAQTRPVMVASIADDASSVGFEGADQKRQAELDRLVTAMSVQINAIRAAIDLPELRGQTNGDGLHGEAKALVDVRYALGAMLESEEVQANAASSFLQSRQRNALQQGAEIDRGIASATGGGSTALDRYAGMPSYRGGRIPLHDAKQLDTWVREVIATTDQREGVASRIIVAAAALCR